MAVNPTEILEQLRQEEEERRRATAAKRAEAAARHAAEREARTEADLARTAEIMRRAANEPERQILGACWLCGSKSNLPQGLVQFQLPLPLGRVDGVICGPCRAAGGDMPEVVTARLWAESKLPERWGWTPRPSPRAMSAVRMGYAVDEDGAPLTEITWTTAADWHTYTWAWHVLEERRRVGPTDKPDRGLQLPRKPFAWLT